MSSGAEFLQEGKAHKQTDGGGVSLSHSNVTM